VTGYCTIIQAERGNCSLLLCARRGSVIERREMAARITDLAAARAEAGAAFPDLEVRVYLPGGAS
jgi:hypothetical protein